jgi:hypothetical protein
VLAMDDPKGTGERLIQVENAALAPQEAGSKRPASTRSE